MARETNKYTNQHRSSRQLSLMMSLIVVWVFYSGCSFFSSSSNYLSPQSPTVLAYSTGVQTTNSNEEAEIEVYQQSDLSLINLPVAISIKELEQIINKEVPTGIRIQKDTVFFPGRKMKRLHSKVEVWKIGDFKFSAKDGYVYVDIPLDVKLELKYGSPKKLAKRKALKTEAKINIHARTTVGINENWQLLLDTEVLEYEWLTNPYIHFMKMDINVTGLAEKRIEKLLPYLLPSLDDKLRKRVDITLPVRKAWIGMQQTRQISKKPKIWFKMLPKEVYTSNLIVDDDSIRIPVGVKAFAETLIGQIPDYSVNTKLPVLQFVDSLENKFKIRVVGTVSYDKLTAFATEKLKGYSHDFREGAYQIKVEDIDIFPTGERLAARVEVSGSISGTIYLKGSPVYDPLTDKISIQDFDYDVNTKNILVNIADWLNHGGFVKRIKKELNFPLEHALADAECRISELLANLPIGKKVLLNGTLDELLPTKIELTPHVLKAVVLARGNAEIKVASEENFVFERRGILVP